MKNIKLILFVILCLLIKRSQMDAAQFPTRHELEALMKEKKIPGLSYVAA